jgi:hypothetical protein
MPVSAASQARMSRAEATQLYVAAGFSIVANRPTNRCGRPTKPRVTFVDINADKRPEALFIDDDAACYPPSGRYFAVLAKAGSQWQAVISGTGSIQAQATRTSGWLDMRVSEAGCEQLYRYEGRKYGASGGCAGQPASTTPQSAQAAPPPTATLPSAAAANAASSLSKADEAAAFKSAGFKQRGATWRNCDDPGTPTYQAGSIERVADLNGDGRPEALIVEGGTYCYGNTGQAFWLVSQGADGRWALMAGETGIAEFLPTKGVGGWPDISVGGPGFCFPVLRWDGRHYKRQRWQYEGKACKPPR